MSLQNHFSIASLPASPKQALLFQSYPSLIVHIDHRKLVAISVTARLLAATPPPKKKREMYVNLIVVDIVTVTAIGCF